jgi:quinol monooxygenase YgiN
MTVLVQMSVKVTDVDRFVATAKRFEPMMAEMGARTQGTYKDDNDPSMVTTISEWDSHDQMHEASEKYGDQFNQEAGTEGLTWETRIWQKQ